MSRGVVLYHHQISPFSPPFPTLLQASSTLSYITSVLTRYSGSPVHSPVSLRDIKSPASKFLFPLRKLAHRKKNFSVSLFYFFLYIIQRKINYFKMIKNLGILKLSLISSFLIILNSH